MTPNGRTSKLRDNICRALQPPLPPLVPQSKLQVHTGNVDLISIHHPVRDAYTIYPLHVPGCFPLESQFNISSRACALNDVGVFWFHQPPPLGL